MSYVEAARSSTSKVQCSHESHNETFSKTGTITKINLRGDAILLSDGTVYLLEKKVALNKFPVGSKVAVTYENRDGLPIATSVQFLAHQFSADPRLVL